MKLTTTALERVAIALASVIVSVGLIAVLSGFFAGRDQAGVSGGAKQIGQQFRDLGHGHLLAGARRPVYDSDPPTSGAHHPEPVRQDGLPLNDDQILQALEVGNIVIMYGGRVPSAGLTAFANAVAGPFTPQLAVAGQAVILAQRPGTAGLTGLAWTRIVHVSAPNDPLLREFAEVWLGRGAPGR